MTRVAIVTDSTACLPRELVVEYGIEIVPMELIHKGTVYRDGVDITPPEFYRLLPGARWLPTTSAPSPGTYFAVLTRVAEKAGAILVITVSAKFSHTFDSAKAAAEMVTDKLENIPVEVLDCGTAAGAQGFVALAAARAAVSCESLDGVVEAARTMMPKVHLVDLWYGLISGDLCCL